MQCGTKHLDSFMHYLLTKGVWECNECKDLIDLGCEDKAGLCPACAKKNENKNEQKNK